MKTHTIAAAALAAVALGLSACASTSRGQIDNAITNAQIVFSAAKTTVDADAKAGIIDSVTAAKIDGYITAGDLALSGAEQAFTAGDAQTEKDKVAAVLAAAANINAAVLAAVAAYSTR